MIDSEEHVVLVNEMDEELGTMEKLEAHRRGELHRALSIFLFDDQGRVLLQKRADGKYHSAGLWTNTCCSHPRPDEMIVDAAHRRLMEEMRIATALEPQFSFIYRADVGEDMIEHELDHVFFGSWSGSPAPDPMEVADWKYVALEELEKELSVHPDHFTAWLHFCWPQVKAVLDRDRKLK